MDKQLMQYAHTGCVSRLRLCWKSWGFKINLRRCLVYLWRTLVPVSWMCKKQTSVSHSSTESEIISLDAGLRMDGLSALDLWDIVIEVLRSTNTMFKPKHYWPRGNWNSFFVIKCLTWITYPQTHILVNVSLSCTFLKITKLWSRWSSKDEVRRWDLSPEPTELLLIGCLTEWTRTSKSKLNMLTPRTNLLTFWPKGVSRKMDGITSCVCSMSWVSRCILVVISKVFVSQVTESIVIGAMSKRGQNTTSNDGSPTAKARPVHLVMYSPWNKETFSRRMGSLVNPGSEDGIRRVGLALGNRLMLYNWTSEVGNHHVSRKEKVVLASTELGQIDQTQTKSEEKILQHSQSSGTWNTQAINTWVRSFKFWRRSWECLQSTQHSQWTQKNQCIDMEVVSGFVDESRHPPWV